MVTNAMIERYMHEVRREARRLYRVGKFSDARRLSRHADAVRESLGPWLGVHTADEVAQ